MKRDEFLCALCQESTKTLEAHHIRPWRSHPELRFQLSNGITLCRRCHEAIGDREADFAQRFEMLVVGRVPVKLSEPETESLHPFIVKCIECGKDRPRARYHKGKRFYFCDLDCKRNFEKRIHGDWKRFTADSGMADQPKLFT